MQYSTHRENYIPSNNAGATRLARLQAWAFAIVYAAAIVVLVCDLNGWGA